MRRFKVNNLNGDDLLHHLNLSLQVKNELMNAESGEKIIMDLSDAQWFAPTFLAPLTVSYHHLRRKGANLEIIPPRSGLVSTYLDQIGFPEGDSDPDTYYDNTLPLFHLDSQEGNDALSSIGSKLKDLLRKQLGSGIRMNAIQYPISELISNVETHSQYDHGTLLTQYYPKKGLLDICIVDDGITIPGNFERYDVPFESDYNSIQKAMIERVTTRVDEDRQQGYGLYTIGNMVTEGLNGQVILTSRNGSLELSDGSPTEILRDYRWDGTIVAIRLNTPDEDFDFLRYLT